MFVSPPKFILKLHPQYNNIERCGLQELINTPIKGLKGLSSSPLCPYIVQGPILEEDLRPSSDTETASP
jgi:hypothetical protein